MQGLHLPLCLAWFPEDNAPRRSVHKTHPPGVSIKGESPLWPGSTQTRVIDGALEHSPAEHVRRPAVPPESPTLGFTHLQFEALLTTARESPRPCDFALVAMLRAARPANLRSHRRQHHRPQRRIRPPDTARLRQGHQGRPDPAAASRRPGHRPGNRRSYERADPSQQPRHPDGLARRNSDLTRSARPASSSSTGCNVAGALWSVDRERALSTVAGACCRREDGGGS